MRLLEIASRWASTVTRPESEWRRRRLASWPVGLLLIAGCCVGQHTALAQNVEITVLLVADSHSHLTPGGPRDENLEGTVGGIARAATVIERERSADPDLLLLHAGDTFVGSLFFNRTIGIAELRLLQVVGVDAMTVGNHEFDLGPQTLAFALATDGTPFPLLGANLDLTGYPDLGAWVRPDVVRNVNGLSVGIFGLTIPGNPLSQPNPVVVLPDVVAIAQQEVDQLRAAGADVVLCLSHLGMPYDVAIASHVAGIDAILGGHDHLSGDLVEVVGPDGSSTPIARAGSFWQHVGRLRLVWNGSDVTVVGYTLLDVGDTVPAQPQIGGMVAALIDDIELRWAGAFSEQVAAAALPLSSAYDTRKPMRDTDMGNLITDALRLRTGTDIALTPKGLIAEGLSRGPMVAEDLFRTVPYGYDQATGLDFPIATFHISGAELLKGLEYGISFIEESDDFLVQVSGLRYRYDSSRPAGDRVLAGSVHVDGRPLDPSATYTATANLGVVLLLPMAGVEISNLEVLPDVEVSALQEYAASLGMVTRPPRGRIRDMSARSFIAEVQPASERRVVRTVRRPRIRTVAD